MSVVQDQRSLHRQRQLAQWREEYRQRDQWTRFVHGWSHLGIVVLRSYIVAVR